jgi:acyl-coenzyme A thioesterase PaaI-like protein
MRPGDTDLICIGKMLKENKSFMVTTAEVLNLDGKLCAYMLQTLKRIRPGDLVKKS